MKLSEQPTYRFYPDRIKLAGPVSYRFYPEQRDWLMKQAKAAGHNSEVTILRKLVQDAMQRNGKRRKTNRNGN